MARLKDKNKENDIFSATLKLVLREGFSGLKMTEVAKNAGIATGTIYIYFKDKTELINALYLHLKKKSTRMYFEGYEANAPFKANFYKLWKKYFMVGLQQPEELAFLEQYYRSPYLSSQVVEESQHMLEPVHKLLEKGKKEMIIKDLHNDVLISFIIGPIHELIDLSQKGILEINETVIKNCFGIVWDGIKN